VKLVIQIPCFNEEQCLPVTIGSLPREIPGIDEIEILVIDDGSTDTTASVARSLGVRTIVRMTSNQGLARAFSAGLDASLKRGADIIVNTDADNQYSALDIPKLVQPILDGTADIVIGDRRTDTIAHFGPVKKKLQKLGSWVVRALSNTDVADATSGFRAYSREAALRMNVFSPFTYTLDTIIQAGQKNLIVASVPVGTNGKLRESRLFKSISIYVRRSIAGILRILAIYQPLKLFTVLGSVFLVGGGALGLRFVIIRYILGDLVHAHIQSVILSGTLLMVGVLITAIGFIAYLISVNRKLNEEILTRVKRLEMRTEKAES